MEIVGKTLKVKIDDYSHEGKGIAHYGKKTIFIDYAQKGKEYEIKVTKKQGRSYRGEIINFVNTSPCPYFGQCGGCQILNQSYKEQLAFKLSALETTLQKQGIDIAPKRVKQNPHPLGYRNKIILSFFKSEGKIKLGYYHEGTHELIAINDCLLASPLVNEIAQEVVRLVNHYPQSLYDPVTKSGNLRHLMIREGFKTKEIMVCFIGQEQSIKHHREIVDQLTQKLPQIKAVVFNQNKRHNSAALGFKNFNLYNCNMITEQLDDCTFLIEPNTFFQVNTFQAQNLYRLVREYLAIKPTDVILDAYCGVGSISCFLAPGAQLVIGAEINDKSIGLARKNAKLNNLDNLDFYTLDLEKDYGPLEKYPINKVVVDPPRSGLSEKMINLLNEKEFESLVYVSCNPATLARDLALLKKSYTIDLIQPVDMFSQTFHVETISLLKAKKLK